MPLPPNGVIIYDGPSTINGAPVVVVLTSLRGKSHNEKTAGDALPMAQTYIIPRAMLEGMAPGGRGAGPWFQNLAAGRDYAACGACELRPAEVAAIKALGMPAPDSCYVLNGPPDVAQGIVNGSYPVVTLDVAAGYVRDMLAAGRIAGVRGGSWGDPGAAPFAVHEALHAATRGVRVTHPDGRSRRAVWTCYTRTWEYAPAVAATGWRRIAMASAHSPAEALLALSRGWRPFTVIDGRNDAHLADATVLALAHPGMHCPASNERGMDASCSTCGACDGAAKDADPRGAVTIFSHGPANRSASACAAARGMLARLDAVRAARAEARRAI